MNAKIVSSLFAAALACGCSTMPESFETQLASASGDGEDPAFPPQVIAGVTQFKQTVIAQPVPYTDVPPNVVWGVTTFPETALPNNYAGGPRDPPPVIWVSFGVTKEAAERELAEAARLPKVAAGAAGTVR